VVRRATRPIDPPTVSNFVAMAAPAGGRDRYDAGEIESVLITAWTAFGAARIESHRSGPQTVAVHTGFWGCGAFGGHGVLMLILQILAAEMGSVDWFSTQAMAKKARTRSLKPEAQST
jgi:hypothetical protein